MLSHLVNGSDSGETSSLRDLRSPFALRVTKRLSRSPLLTSLAQLQRTLDALDIEGLDEYWRRYHRSLQSSDDDTSLPPLGDHEPEPTLEEWEVFVTTYFENSAHDAEKLKTGPFDDRTISKEELRYHILAYLMSATFKDCSIILRLTSASLPHSSLPIEESVTAIDLDPKSVRRLEKWRQLDRDIAATYSKYLATLSNAS
jgi:inositol-pentakisphosphate 2-kinase